MPHTQSQSLALRRSWNEHTCRRCRRVFDGQFPLCPTCSTTVRRLNEARAILAQSDADRRRPFPPARPRLPWE